MKRIFSGIQPSGNIHLGNYLGAIKQWVELSEKVDESIFCIVDLHAITLPQDPKELQKNILSVAATYVAAGINPEKSTIFVQSNRPEHCELQWILNTITTVGELSRMTQFKDKAGISDKLKKITDSANRFENLKREYKEAHWPSKRTKIFGEILEGHSEIQQHYFDSVDTERIQPVGLFDYPVLMAADILLYQTSLVPVGDDQKQHVELTRDLAQRFNKRFGETFVIPEPIIKKETARIMGLDDPTKKMSKSASSPLNYIALNDDADMIRNKIKRAVTDSGSEIKSGSDKPAMTNLLNIYSELSGLSVSEIENKFVGKGYGDFKVSLAEVIVDSLKPLQDKYQALMADEKYLKEILTKGSERIAPLAKETIEDVKSKVGLGI